MSLFTNFKRRVFRASKPSWAYAPTSGDGAARHGGRFNPRGHPALYTSLNFETCAREVRFSLNTDPYTFYQINVESSAIADLTSHSVREQLNISWQHLECPNWEAVMNKGDIPASQKVAMRLYEEGCHGIIVPSFAPSTKRDDHNLVLLNWKTADAKGSDSDECAWVDVLNRDLLPKD